MKTFWSFVAGGVAVAFLCAASGVQKEWEVHSVCVGLISEGPDKKMIGDLPHGSEPIGSHVQKEGSLNQVYIIYRIPKK